jgi:hypothetical protein
MEVNLERTTDSRKPRKSFADYIHAIRDEIIVEGEQTLTRGELAIRTAFLIASDQKHPLAVQAMKFLAERADGGVQQRIDLTSSGQYLGSQTAANLTDEQLRAMELVLRGDFETLRDVALQGASRALPHSKDADGVQPA